MKTLILIVCLLLSIQLISGDLLDEAIQSLRDDSMTLSVSEPKEANWIKLKNLFHITMRGGAVFNPKRNEIAFISNENGVAQIFKQNYNGFGGLIGSPKLLLSTKDRCTTPTYLGGSENFQIGYADTFDKITWITNDTRSAHNINHLSKKFLYFSSNRRTRHIEIFRRAFPLDGKGKIELIYSPPKNSVANIAFATNDDRYLFIEQSYSNLKQEIVIHDAIAHKTFFISRSVGPNRRWTPIGFLDGSNTTLVVKTDFQSDFSRIALLKLSENYEKVPEFVALPYFDRIEHEVTRVERLTNSNTFYVTFNMNGYTKLVRIHFNSDGSLAADREIKLPLPQANIITPGLRSYANTLAVSPDALWISITITNSVTPTSLYIIDAKHLTPTLIQGPKLPPAIQDIKFVSETTHKFGSWDHLQVPYLLYKPHGEMPRGGYPTIVLLHGGPESQAKPEFSPIRQFLLHNGFAIAEPNIRGSAGYGRKYQNMDNRENRMKAIKDIIALCRHLKKYNFVNTRNLIVMGGSYGGYASLLSITKYPTVFRAGVDIVGMSNLVTFLKNTATWRRKLREPEYGFLDTQRDMLEAISPSHYVSQLRSPIYVIQGANDPRVPVSEAKQIFKKVQRVGDVYPRVAMSKLLILKDEGHGFSKRTNRMMVYHSLIKWLNKVIKKQK